MTRALRVIFGKQSLTADAAAAALVNGSAPALKDLRDLIDRALATAPASDLDETLWGQEPSEAEVAGARRTPTGLVRRLCSGLLVMRLPVSRSLRAWESAPKPSPSAPVLISFLRFGTAGAGGIRAGSLPMTTWFQCSTS